MHSSRSGCWFHPGKASAVPSLVDDLLFRTSASSHPVEMSTAHCISFSRRSLNPPKYGRFLWFPVPTTDLSSGLLLLKPCPPELSTLLQIYPSSPDNHRRTLTPTRLTIKESDFLLVGLVSFDGPLMLQQIKPTTKKSRFKLFESFLRPVSLLPRFDCKGRSCLHCISIVMSWVCEDQFQSLVQSISPAITLYPSSRLLGNLPLVSDQIYGERKDGIMTPPPWSSGYRHLLNPLISYPVFTEPHHVQSIFSGKEHLL